MDRRNMISLLMGTMMGLIPANLRTLAQPWGKQNKAQKEHPMKITPLPPSGPWPTSDPFLFCVHHLDAYPESNGSFGPNTSLSGRNIGQDFANKDGWNMYHGQNVPGFPQHPHRGFETLTVVQKGLVDHSDSLGAKARYGNGDAQWLTAGDGIVHAEMFPLLDEASDNPLELFQIWINLPARNKRVKPHFSMMWDEEIPRATHRDGDGKRTEIQIVAGEYQGKLAPAPPPDSWAADPQNELVVWVIEMEEGAVWELPSTDAAYPRSLYLLHDTQIALNGEEIPKRTRVELDSRSAVSIGNLSGDAKILLLQGRAIDEPVVQYGPFVMNSPEEIREAYQDYSETRFGGWPWQEDGPVHGGKPERFARLIDGSRVAPKT